MTNATKMTILKSTAFYLGCLIVGNLTRLAIAQEVPPTPGIRYDRQDTEPIYDRARNSYRDDEPSPAPWTASQYDMGLRLASPRAHNPSAEFLAQQPAPADSPAMQELTPGMQPLGNSPPPSNMQMPFDGTNLLQPSQSPSPAHSLKAIGDQLIFSQESERVNLKSMEENLDRLLMVLEKQREQIAAEKRRAQEYRAREQVAIQVAKEAKMIAESAQLREREAMNLAEQARAEAAKPAPVAPDVETPTPPADDTMAATPKPEKDATVEMMPAPAAQTITDMAVDKRALADNLFGSGEYKLALDVYQELLGGQPPPGEAVWYRYQAATASRHLKDPQRAATYYREVAADRNNEFLSENAKWWLNVMENNTNNDRRLQELSMMMEQIRNNTEAQP